MEELTDEEKALLETQMAKLTDTVDEIQPRAEYVPIDWDELRADVKKAVTQVFAERDARDAELAKRIVRRFQPTPFLASNGQETWPLPTPEPVHPVINALNVMREPDALQAVPPYRDEFTTTDADDRMDRRARRKAGRDRRAEGVRPVLRRHASLLPGYDR